MTTAAADPLLDSLVSDFGGNYVFALDLLEQYRQDRGSVDRSWRDYFDRIAGVPPTPEDSAAPVVRAGTPGGPEPAREMTLVRSQAAVPAPRDRSKALVVPAILPGDIATPIRGGAVRVVENMEASLTVPTATSIRTIPVRTLEENRRILNKHRDATGGAKVSFTHMRVGVRGAGGQGGRRWWGPEALSDAGETPRVTGGTPAPLLDYLSSYHGPTH